MNFKEPDINRFLQKPDSKVRCVLLFGTNEGMIADLAQKFALTVTDDLTDAFRVSTFISDDIEKDVGALFGEYNAVSLMGGRRVIFIKGATNNLTKPLKELLSSSSSDTFLVITSTTLNTKSSLVNFLKDAPDSIVISCYEDRQQDINTFIRNFFSLKNITITLDAQNMLSSRLSADRKVSENELEKLITYIGARKNVTLDDVVQTISQTSTTSLEDLCYAVSLGKSESTFKAYQNLINEGEEPATVLRYITYHFLKILDCISSMEKGMPSKSVIETFKPPLVYFRKPDFLTILKIWKRRSVLDVLSLLYKAERDCKTTGFPATEIASYTLLQISSAAKKLQK